MFKFLNNKNKPKMSIDKQAALKEVSQMEAKIKELRKIIEAPEIADYKTFTNSKVSCEYLGVRHRIPYSNPENHHEEAANAYYELTMIIAAIWKTTGTKLETKNTNQNKYYAWVKQSDSGFGLSYDRYGYWDTITNCGVRFALPTSELAIYVGKTFIPLYNKLDNQ